MPGGRPAVFRDDILRDIDPIQTFRAFLELLNMVPYIPWNVDVVAALIIQFRVRFDMLDISAALRGT